MTTNELWYLLIDGQQDAETGIVGNFYAYGNHLGDALDKTIKASIEYKFTNHNLTEASLLDSFDAIGDNNELIRINNTIYISSLNSDGAGGYAVLWIVEKGKFKKRIIFIPF